jgi:hypothetical protein
MSDQLRYELNHEVITWSEKLLLLSSKCNLIKMMLPQYPFIIYWLVEVC